MTNPNPPPRKGRGCFFYGCLSLVILSVIACLGAYLAYRWGVSKYNEFVDGYTDTNGVQIQTVELAPERLEALKQQINAFGAALERQTNAMELVLNADDLNGLIASEPGAKDLKGRLFVRIEDDEITGQISFPLDNLKLPRLSGRYLNGEATFQVSLTNDLLEVFLNNVRVNGKELPGTVMKQLRKENLAKEVQNNPEQRDAVRKLESIQIRDGNVILRTKPPGGP